MIPRLTGKGSHERGPGERYTMERKERYEHSLRFVEGKEIEKE
jgi:hypothetical protein